MRMLSRALAAPVLVLVLAIAAHAAGDEARPFFIDLIKTDAKLFDVQIARFTPTQNEELLQQYFASNLRKNGGKFGAFIEVAEIYRTERLEGTPLERVERLEKWTGALTPDKELPAEAIARGRIYLAIRRLSLTRDRLDPADPAVAALVKSLDEYVAANDKDGWGVFLQALAAQVLRIRGVESGFPSPPLALLAKASMLATQDGHLHYVLGHLYGATLDDTDVGTYLKLVTAEFEKCLLLQPSNRELFTRVTGVYVDIHERYQGRGTDEPFWFEELVYKRIIALDPTNAQAHNNLSFLYSSLGVNLKQALREARIATQLRPEDPYLLDTLGWAYYRNGMLQDALKVLTKAVELKPDLADVHFHLASVHYDLDDFEPTVRHFREAIRLDPRNAFARNNLAYFFSEKNRNLEEGLELVDQALALSPDNAAFLDTKGWLLYRLGRLDEAVPHIKRALALAPETSELHLHLGQILLEKKQFPDAIRAFEHALAYDPENQAVARRLSRLFALQALETTMRTYGHIAGVKTHKENFKIFYDLMARIHTEDGDYVRAAEALREYHDLRPGDTPGTSPRPVRPEVELPEGTGPVEGETPTPPSTSAAPADAGAAWTALAQVLPPGTDLVAGLNGDGLTAVVDVALENLETPLPAPLLRALIVPRLPGRVLLGLSVAGFADPRTAVLAFDFPADTLDQIRSRLAGLAGSGIEVPGAGAPVQFDQQIYKGRPLGQIAFASGSVSYLVASDRLFLLGLDRSHLVRVADALAEGTALTGPPLLTSAEWGRFARDLGSRPHHAVTFLTVPSRERLADLPLSDRYRSLVTSVGTASSSYRVTEGDLLEERTCVTPADGIDPAELQRVVASVVDGLRAGLSDRTNGAVTCESAFKTQDGRVEGVVLFRGVQAWLGELLSNVEFRPLGPEAPRPPMPGGNGDEGDEGGEGGEGGVDDEGGMDDGPYDGDFDGPGMPGLPDGDEAAPEDDIIEP